ncbi:MAG: hypothetical protein ACFCU3_05350 [Verrucomicrobiales bacterium]
MRLILHAGTHKTATKTFQAYLVKNKEAFKESGLIFPQPSAERQDKRYWAHNWLAQALAGHHEEDTAMAREMLDRAARQARGEGALVLSAEDISCCCAGHPLWSGLDRGDFRDLQREYLRLFAEVVKGFQVEVVMLFRRADVYAQSLYQTVIRSHRFTGSFESWLKYGRPLFEYAKQLEIFTEVFGNVQALSYHKLSGHLPHNLLVSLGYDLPRNPLSIRNVSTDPRLTCWTWMRNSISLPSREEIRTQKRFCRSEYVRQLFADFGSATFWHCAEDAAEFHREASMGMDPGRFPPPSAHSGISAYIDEATYTRISEAFELWEGT